MNIETFLVNLGGITMVTVTVKVPSKIHKDFKIACIKEGITINQKVEDLINTFLDRKEIGENIKLKDYPEEEKSVTIRMDSDLHQELKYYCARKDKKIKNIVKKRIIKYALNSNRKKMFK